MYYGIVLAAAVLLGAGYVFQQHAAEEAPKSHFLSLRLAGDLLRKPLWLLGIVAMVGGQGLSAWALGHVELSFVEPLLTTNLLFALIIAIPLSGAAVRATEVGGALLLIAGEAMLSLGRSTWPIGLSFGSASHWPAAAVIALIAFIAVRAGRRYPGTLRATLTGVGAGLLFGIQDALTRQSLQILDNSSITALLANWSVYCLIGTAIVGIWLMQSAFNAGPLHASLGTITAGEPVAGIVLGILVFGDRVQLTPGSIAMELGGMAALVVGVIGVARAPALSGLRKAAGEAVHHTRVGAQDYTRDHAAGSDRAVGDGSVGDGSVGDGSVGDGAAGHHVRRDDASRRRTPGQGTPGNGAPDHGERDKQPRNSAMMRWIPSSFPRRN